ncbi:MAG: hypothetical protein ABL926_00475 [Novosphingobium sp.]|uniref:hypothetical protein n=1 Tax=Novosphingobium sp. TaxID=1874826 RepID=UPI0032B8268C
MVSASGLALAAAALASLPTERCYVLTSAKHVGEAVYADDVVPVACAAQAGTHSLSYDRRRKMVVARRELGPGTALGSVWLPVRPPVASGDQIWITAKIGHVTLSRSAVALQSANSGQRYFVRTQDGHVFVAPATEKDGAKR